MNSALTDRITTSAVNLYRKSLGVTGDGMTTSYAETVRVLDSVWEDISRHMSEISTWDMVDCLKLLQLGGFQCIGLLDYDGIVHTCPYPLNWEIA